MTESSDQVLNLEQDLQEINQIIAQMEQGSLTLEQSLKLFERAVGLTKNCQNILNAAEQKVQLLLQGSNTLSDITSLKSDHEGVISG